MHLVGYGTDSGLGSVVELVEEEAANRLGRTAVPGEQGALDDLGEVGDGKNRAVEVGEELAEDGALRRRKLLNSEAGAGGGVNRDET